MTFVEFLEAKEDMLELMPMSESEIEEAEQSLRIHFSDEYRAYTLKHGAVSFDNHELTGVVDSKRLNVVKVTERIRETMEIADDLYVVEEMGIDHMVILQNTNGEVFLLSDMSGIKKVASSLSEYYQTEECL